MKEKKTGIKVLIKSFGYSFEGIKEGYKSGQNIIIMTVIGIIAIILSFIFKIDNFQKLIIILLIGIILPLELINTAIEACIDLHDGDKKSKNGKIAKDCAAGALTISCIISLIIGIIIFMPYLIELFK